MDSTWEEETLQMLKDAQSERDRAIQRVEVARRTVVEADGEIDVIKRLLAKYRAEHGLPRTTDADPSLAAAYENKTGGEVINEWAEAHDGQVVMIDLAKALVAAGLFGQVTQATGFLYPTASRMTKEGNLRKERPGVYLVVPPAPRKQQLPPAPGAPRGFTAGSIAEAITRAQDAMARGGYEAARSMTG